MLTLLAPPLLTMSSEELCEPATNLQPTPIAPRPFIVDGGWSQSVRQANGELKYLARYEVWCNAPPHGGLRCIERADDLAALKVKYALGDDDVLYWPIGSPVLAQAGAHSSLGSLEKSPDHAS